MRKKLHYNEGGIEDLFVMPHAVTLREDDSMLNP